MSLSGSIIISIPNFSPKQKTAYNWTQHEVHPSALTQAFVGALMSTEMILQPAETFALPSSRLQLQEYKTQLRLQEQLPLLFVPPNIEQQHYDFVVEGAKWQMKVAGYMGLKTNDHFRVHVKTSYGMLGGKKVYGQYRPEHFDWLAVLLPDHNLLKDVAPHMYLIPMAVLQERGYVGRNGITGSTVCLYPHRMNKAHWTKQFLIDLSSPTIALCGYRLIVRNSQIEGEAL